MFRLLDEHQFIIDLIFQHVTFTMSYPQLAFLSVSIVKKVKRFDFDHRIGHVWGVRIWFKN